MITTPDREKKPYPVCPKCANQMDSRISRGFLVKNLLFFLPLKRYKCLACGKKKYFID